MPTRAQPEISNERPGSASFPPGLANAFIFAVTASGIAVLAAQTHPALHWNGTQLLSAGALCLATLVTELFPLHLRHTTETATFSVTDVVWAAALVLAPSSVLLVGLAIGVLISQTARGMAVRKIAFNVGQFVAAMCVAESVFQLVPHSGPLDPVTWAAAGVAMALNFIVNEALVGLVISLMEHEPLGSVVWSSLGMDVLPAIGNMTIGIIAAVMWELTPVGVLVAAVPVLLSYLAYAGSLQNVRERDRMRDLYRAGQVLLERLETVGDFSSFLELVARMMDGDEAEIVLVRDGVVTVHGPSGLDAVIPSPAADSDPARAASCHRDRPGTICESAAIGAPGPEMGSLAVFRRTPLSATERSLLEALAAQVYVKLRHSEVFAWSVAKEQELARIISSTSDGIFVIGEDGRIRSWSPAMERITGVDADRTVGRALWSVLTVPAGEDEVWVRFGNPTYLATDGIETGAFARPDGSVGWVRFSRSVLRSPEGFPVGMVVVARDVSADIQAEQAKTNFIAAISHELRTPLTPLKGYLSLLASGEMAVEAKEARDSFEVMLRHAGRLERLINDLLDASQMEMGRPAIRSEKVDLVQLVPGPTRALGAPDRAAGQLALDRHHVERDLVARVLPQGVEDRDLRVRMQGTAAALHRVHDVHPVGAEAQGGKQARRCHLPEDLDAVVAVLDLDDFAAVQRAVELRGPAHRGMQPEGAGHVLVHAKGLRPLRVGAEVGGWNGARRLVPHAGGAQGAPPRRLAAGVAAARTRGAVPRAGLLGRDAGPEHGGGGQEAGGTGTHPSDCHSPNVKMRTSRTSVS